MIAGAIAIRQRSIIPGFGLSLGVMLSYLGLIVIIPLCVLLLKASDAGWAKIWMELSSLRTLAAFRVSFGIAFLAAAFNAVFGFIVAWVLVRYEFVGRRLIDAMIDLPFALPTAVAGVSLTQIYAENGWLGSVLAVAGIKVAFTPLGILVALAFVGLPFVVRTVQPILQDFDREAEEAGALLGASRWNILRRVVFPPLVPAVMTGFTLAFARGIERIRLRHLYCRQYARLFRDRSAADHHQARAVRLCGRNRDREPDAGGVLHPAAHHQPAAGMDPETARCLTMHRALTRVRRRASRCR